MQQLILLSNLRNKTRLTGPSLRCDSHPGAHPARIITVADGVLIRRSVRGGRRSVRSEILSADHNGGQKHQARYGAQRMLHLEPKSLELLLGPFKLYSSAARQVASL
jgi:hypothetical protein